MWTETLRPLKNVSTQAPFRTFGTSLLSRDDAKTAGRFRPILKRNVRLVFHFRQPFRASIVIGPGSSRRTLITMGFGAVGIPLRQDKTRCVARYRRFVLEIVLGLRDEKRIVPPATISTSRSNVAPAHRYSPKRRGALHLNGDRRDHVEIPTHANFSSFIV